MRRQVTRDDIEREWAKKKLTLDERARRLWAARQSKRIGHGGITLVSEVTDLSRDTIRRGRKELQQPEDPRLRGRSRAPGGGRTPLAENNPELKAALDALIDPLKDASQSPLRWTSKGTRVIARELNESSHPVSERTIAALLRADGYELRSLGGRFSATATDRSERVAKLNERIKSYRGQRNPVVDVRVWQSDGALMPTNDGDPAREARHNDSFTDLTLRTFLPNEVPDAKDHLNWRPVGINGATAAIAAASIQSWWYGIGVQRFPGATHLLIVADKDERPDESNKSLQALADRLRMVLEVWPYPRITSRWNMAGEVAQCFATSPQGELMRDRKVAVRLIGDPDGVGRLGVRAALDSAECSPGNEPAATQTTSSETSSGNTADVWFFRPKNTTKQKRRS